MKLAFLISAHTDAPQLKRLIEALPDDSLFFVHIDRKSDITPFITLLGTNDHVHFLNYRVNVMWGSINEVEYQMELVRAALENRNEFDYLVTLSGMDYPIWDKHEIISFFEENKGKEYICGANINKNTKGSKLYRQFRFQSDKPWKYGSLKSKFRVALREITWYLGFRKPLTINTKNGCLKLYKGAAWWAISSGLANYILREWDNNSELVSYFKTSFCPAETFSQTVAFNSPKWRSKCIEYEEWIGLTALTPLTYIHYHPVIKIMVEDDYDKIINSGKMFARKFVTGKSDKLVMMLRNKCNVNNKQIHANEQ